MHTAKATNFLATERRRSGSRRTNVPCASGVHYLVLLLATALFAVPGLGQVTYSYVGQPFTLVQHPHEDGDRVIGSFTIAESLPTFTRDIDLSTTLVDYSFHDGVRSWSPDNSTVCGFTISTDSYGNLVEWNIEIREAPFLPSSIRPFLGVVGFSAPVVVRNGDAAGTYRAHSTDDCRHRFSSSSFNSGSNRSKGVWTAPDLPATPLFTYLYTGAPFDDVGQPFRVGDRLMGQITTVGRIPPALPPTDISFIIFDARYSDGVFQHDLDNSGWCQMSIATNNDGYISEWHISMAGGFPPIIPPPPSPGFDSQAPGADSVGAFWCDFGPASPASSSEGEWTLLTSSVEVPQLSPWGLFLFVGLLSVIGLAVMIRSR